MKRKAGVLLALLIAGPALGDEWTGPDWRDLENQSVPVAVPAPVEAPSAVPGLDAFFSAVNAAMKGKWAYSRVYGKCLQYSGDVAHRATGDPDKIKTRPNPVKEYSPATSLGGTKVRGLKITELDALAASGELKPGMLVHVKQHYKVASAYTPRADGHHWFVYLGLVKLACKDETVAVFADNIKAGVDRNPKGQLGRSESDLCWPETTVDGKVFDWRTVATTKQIQGSVYGMTWKKADCDDKAYCECTKTDDGDPAVCKGNQRVTAVYDPWAAER